MRMFRVPYRWLPRTFFININWIFSDIIGGIKNIFRWTPVIWFDADYDWIFLAQIMEYKLRRMSDYEKRYGHHLTSLKDAKNQQVCADLLKRLIEDNYWENAKVRFDSNILAAQHVNTVKKNDQKYLGILLGKYLTHWWD